MSDINFKPTKKQLEFMSWEFGTFFHFGIRTFNEYHIDWDMKPMEPSSFNPTELDCEQWICTVKNACVKYAVMTTKPTPKIKNPPEKIQVDFLIQIILYNLKLLCAAPFSFAEGKYITSPQGEISLVTRQISHLRSRYITARS